MTTSTAIVTGAGRGIGRAIAVELGRLGFQVAINYHANKQAAEQCAAAVKDAGGKALIVQADVSSSEDRQRLVRETIGQFGPIRLLVNNAGVAPKVRADLLELSEASYDEVLATNLRGPLFLTQLVARHMAEQDADQPRSGGRAIINITSVSAYAASVNRGEYCIAKAGLAMMTQLFAARLAEFGVNVYEIRPGVIATDMTAKVKDKYDEMILEKGLTPIRRWGRPEDIARAVGAIARGDFPFSTGMVLDVDGGFRVRVL